MSSHPRAREAQPLDLARLGPEARTFAGELFARWPSWLAHGRLLPGAGAPDGDLLVEVPSPTGDPRLALVVWTEGGEPCLGWGGYRARGALLRVDDGSTEPFLARVEAILGDQFVLTSDAGFDADHGWQCLDLRSAERLLEQLTAPHSPGRVNIRSWSGLRDGELGLEDLDVATGRRN